jgi:hypothetical protein
MNIHNYRNFNKSNMNRAAFVAILLASCLGCQKFVNVNPPVQQITPANVYSNNTSAASVMTGIYSNMVYVPAMASGNFSLSFLEGLAADELTNYDPTIATFVQFYQNALSSASSGTSNAYFWQEIYTEIYVTNAVIEGVAHSSGISSSIKQQLDGEAKFIRAFYYFYAVNLYGDVPLPISTNYATNNVLRRTTKAQIYQQIVNDLKDAQTELSAIFVNGSGIATSERVRPNKGAAEALLARVYLYTNDWTDAVAEADSVISNTTNYALTGLSQVFLKNSTEAIWQLAPTTPLGYDTWDADYFVLTSPPGPGSNSVAVSAYLLNAFDSGDNRKTSWIGVYTADSINYYYYPYKYENYLPGNPITEYTMVLRLAEQYLIRAEAETRINDLGDAANDLNIIRNRAGLPNISPTIASSNQLLLNAILHERQVELFTEWGHRWFDLIRVGEIDSVMGSPGNVCSNKGGNWNPNDTLAPLPLSELQVNPNLTQNPGY